MPEFAYIARDVGGRKVAGKLSAGTQAEALALLSGQQLFPLSVEADAATVRAGRGRKVKTALLTTFYGQLADLLRSGVPLLRALEVLRKQASQPALVEVLARVQDDVKDGKPLAEAFARHPRVFGDMAVSMVRAGTEGGFLEEALERVAEFTEKQDELRGRTQGALAYPVFLGVVGAAVVAVLLVFFVPKFEGLFARLRQRGELPAMTDWLLAFSGFFGLAQDCFQVIFIVQLYVQTKRTQHCFRSLLVEQFFFCLKFLASLVGIKIVDVSQSGEIPIRILEKTMAMGKD